MTRRSLVVIGEGGALTGSEQPYRALLVGSETRAFLDVLSGVADHPDLRPPGY